MTRRVRGRAKARAASCRRSCGPCSTSTGWRPATSSARAAAVASPAPTSSRPHAPPRSRPRRAATPAVVAPRRLNQARRRRRGVHQGPAARRPSTWCARWHLGPHARGHRGRLRRRRPRAPSGAAVVPALRRAGDARRPRASSLTSTRRSATIASSSTAQSTSASPSTSTSRRSSCRRERRRATCGCGRSREAVADLAGEGPHQAADRRRPERGHVHHHQRRVATARWSPRRSSTSRRWRSSRPTACACGRWPSRADATASGRSPCTRSATSASASTTGRSTAPTPSAFLARVRDILETRDWAEEL